MKVQKPSAEPLTFEVGLGILQVILHRLWPESSYLGKSACAHCKIDVLAHPFAEDRKLPGTHTGLLRPTEHDRCVCAPHTPTISGQRGLSGNAGQTFPVTSHSRDLWPLHMS